MGHAGTPSSVLALLRLALIARARGQVPLAAGPPIVRRASTARHASLASQPQLDGSADLEPPDSHRASVLGGAFVQASAGVHGRSRRGNESLGVELSIRHTIEGALQDDACMFSFVPVPNRSGEFAGAYRAGHCSQVGDSVVAFRAAGLGAATQPEAVQWLSRTSMERGEDPRCFHWRGSPACLTWTAVNGRFRLLLFENSSEPRVVELDPGFTGTVGGKNWVPVPAEDGGLYLVVALDPFKVLRYDGVRDGLGRLEWHHFDPRASAFEWRGGTPAAFFEAGGRRGYVGLGHHSVTTSEHKVMAYAFSPDLHSVELLRTGSFLLPSAREPRGIWDPLSIWRAGVQDGTGFPEFGAVVSYWDDVLHKSQRTHLVSFTVFPLESKPA